MAQSSLTSASLAAAFVSGGSLSQLRSALYFSVTFGSLLAALLAFPWRTLATRRPLLLILAPAFSLVSLVLTWRLILIFFVGFTTRYASHPDPPNLFVEAYVHVCDAAAGWWWSSTLLCWVTVACPVAHAEAARRGMTARSAFAYITVAFLGAVSLAFPLFLSHLIAMSPPPREAVPVDKAVNDKDKAARAKSVTWLWPACTLAALLSTLALPLSVHGQRAMFIASLAVLHVVLAVPFAADALCSYRVAPLSRVQLRTLAAAVALLHIGASAAAVHELRPHSLLELANGLLDAAGRRANAKPLTLTLTQTPQPQPQPKPQPQPPPQPQPRTPKQARVPSLHRHRRGPLGRRRRSVHGRECAANRALPCARVLPAQPACWACGDARPLCCRARVCPGTTEPEAGVTAIQHMYKLNFGALRLDVRTEVAPLD